MTTPNPPKALLFDIGGVIVKSPMAAIANYEHTHSLPAGWINFSISRSGPQGSWARLERGEILLDAAFFREFDRDLAREDLWREYVAKNAGKEKESGTWEKVVSRKGIPKVPALDSETLFWEMMRMSREPDKCMWGAVKKLRESGRFLVAALSNTSIFPAGHEYNEKPQDPDLDVKGSFKVFVSSAHVGMRKPEPRIYKLAMKMMRDEWKALGKEGELMPGEVLFLDDIGTNLSQGRRAGFRTLKVILNDTKSAVKELEKITGLQLLDEVESKL